jgi:phospholipid/cholesterol/gamma-HCH transport system ATP-binding protein
MPDADDAIVLEFHDVTVRFDETVALDRVALQVRRGETWVFLGAAGSGKTVLLKTAMGLIHPDEGSVSVFGKEITKMEERELFQIRSEIGMLFQESALFDSLTIEENVSYPLENQPGRNLSQDEIHNRVVEALRFVELEDTLKKVPSELSGGMRRRVGIARAAVTDPALVLYDSPTAGLDPITANNIMAFIAKQRDVKHTTSLIVSHRFQDGELMANYEYNPQTEKLERRTNGNSPTKDIIFVVMQEGRIAFQGTLAELAQATDSYVSKFGRR